MTVSDEHTNERPRAKRTGHSGNMTRGSDARVNQRGLGSVDEPRVVTGTGQRPGIVRVDERGGGMCGHENGRAPSSDRSRIRPRAGERSETKSSFPVPMFWKSNKRKKIGRDMILRCSDGTREQGAVRVATAEVGPGTTRGIM